VLQWPSACGVLTTRNTKSVRLQTPERLSEHRCPLRAFIVI